MMIKNLIVFLLFAFVGVLATSQTIPKGAKLYNGSPTSIGTNAFIVAIFYQGNFVCAGAIISNTEVYTAASCIKSLNLADWQVRSGSAIATSGGTTSSVTNILIHPSFNSANANYDIAKLTIASRDPASSIIPLGIFVPTDGTQVRVLGWGATSSSGGAPSYQLQEVVIPTINKWLCSTRYTLAGKSLGNTLFCAANWTWFILTFYTAQICQFDLGDPVVLNGQLVGIGTQIISGCGPSRPPSVFTSVGSVQPF